MIISSNSKNSIHTHTSIHLLPHCRKLFFAIFLNLCLFNMDVRTLLSSPPPPPPQQCSMQWQEYLHACVFFGVFGIVACRVGTKFFLLFLVVIAFFEWFLLFYPGTTSTSCPATPIHWSKGENAVAEN